MMQKSLLAALVCVAFLSLASRAGAKTEEESVRIYRQLKPSVVSLENEEGSGTGIVLSADGLILTNAHVVASPLPFQCTIDAPDPAAPGKTRAVTFKDVQIVGYHPRLDLALVRINPRDEHVLLQPAKLSKQKGDPGQHVYVIGNPGAGGQIMTKSISGGMLSAVDRVVEGERYYQTDAAINPGNSGGPMVDGDGEVLGLVTFKFVDVEAIGFAIPLTDLDVKAFVPLTQRKADHQRAAALCSKGGGYLIAAQDVLKREGVESERFRELVFYAMLCYHQAVEADPSSQPIYLAVGQTLLTLKRDNAAKAYLWRAIRMGPPNELCGQLAYHLLGLAYLTEKHMDEARVILEEGATQYPYAANVWSDLTVLHAIQNHPFEAAYAATMALVAPDVFYCDDEPERANKIAMLTDVRRLCLSALGKDQLRRAEQLIEPTALASDLDRRLAASNSAFADRKMFMTKAFIDLVEESGGPAQVAERPLTSKMTRRDERQWGPVAFDGRLVDASHFQLKAAAVISISTVVPNGPQTADPVASSTSDRGSQLPTVPAAPPETVVVGRPLITGTELAGEPRTVEQIQFAVLDVEHVVAVEWADDAKFVYALQSDGVLRKISVPDMKEQRRINLGVACSDLARGKFGLAVAVPAAQEVWVVSESLQIGEKIPVPGVQRVVASPASFACFATGVAPGSPTAALVPCTVLDMSAGKVIGQVKESDVAKTGAVRRLSFERVALSPDGRYLFAEGASAVRRFRVDGMRLTLDQSIDALGTRPANPVITADSRFVAFPCASGNGLQPGASRKDFPTFVYRCEDLKQPIVTIRGDAYPTAIGFDPVTHAVYGQNVESQLIVFSPNGQRQADYALARQGAIVDRFLVHPAGKRLMILCSGHLLWVTLP